MNKSIINYIKENNYISIKNLLDEFEVEKKDIYDTIREYNKNSFYYKVEIIDDIIYFLDNTDIFSNKRKDRLDVLKYLYLCGIFSIEELEIIFGRNRKTLYKDIKKIKEELKEEYNKKSEPVDIFYQSILNNVDYEILKKIKELKRITITKIYFKLAQGIDILLELDKHQEVMEKRLYLPYSFESRVLSNDIFNKIERYKKKNIIDKTIKKKLISHIESSYYRYKNKVFEKRIEVNNIIKSYADDYYEISTIIKMVFKSNNLYFSEEEILFISIYFLNNDIYQNIKVKVSSKRESMKLFMKRELEKNFYDFTFVDSEYDILVSDDINLTGDVCIVKIPFDVYEIKMLSRFLKFRKEDVLLNNLYFKIKPLLKKNIDFESFKKKINYKQTNNSLELKDYIFEDQIKIINENINWEKSIKEATKILEEKNFITNKYYEDVIKLVKMYNTETIIVDNIALIHAPISNAVLNSSFSFILNKKSIIFPNNKKVNLIILFSANNEIDLLLPLIDLHKILLNSEKVDLILKANQKKELKSLLSQKIK